MTKSVVSKRREKLLSPKTLTSAKVERLLVRLARPRTMLLMSSAPPKTVLTILPAKEEALSTISTAVATLFTKDDT